MEFQETYQKSSFGDVWFYSTNYQKIKFTLYAYEDDPNIIYLSNVRIDESLQGQGYGNEILKEAEQQALSKGFSTIELKVLINSWTHDWYRRHGYSDLCYDENKNYIWMKKELY